MVRTHVYEKLVALTPADSMVYYNIKEHHVESEEEKIGMNLFPPTEASWYNIEELPFQTRPRQTSRLLGF